MRSAEDPDPGTLFLFNLVAELEPRVDLGPGPLGRRVFDRVRSGTFTGPRLSGELLPGSSDPLLIGTNGVAAIDARVMLRTDDGAHILMTYTGRVVIPAEVRPLIADPTTRHEIDPARYYIRSTPVFETGAPHYLWLNEMVALGYGYLTPDGGIGYHVYAVS
jgi:hypothetical protein